MQRQELFAQHADTLGVLFESGDTIVATHATPPNLAPLALHFAAEQIEWTTGKPAVLVAAEWRK